MPTGVPSTRAISKVVLTTAGLALVLYLLYLVRAVLQLVVIAVFLAVALGPAVDIFSRLLRRGVAILAVYVLLLAAIVGIGLLIVPPIVSQVGARHPQLRREAAQVQDLGAGADRRRR